MSKLEIYHECYNSEEQYVCIILNLSTFVMTRIPSTFLSILLMSVLHLSSYGQTFQSLYEIPSLETFQSQPSLSSDGLRSSTPNALEEGVVLDIDHSLIENIYQSKSELLSINLEDDAVNPTTLLLRQVNITNPGFNILVKGESGTEFIVDQSIHYRGIISGQPESKVAISISNDEIMGMIINKKYQKTLAKLTTSNQYIYYKNDDLKALNTFECIADDLQSITQNPSSDQRANPDNCVGMHLEVDYDIYNSFGSVTATANYITGLFNQVSSLYAAESININIQELVIWSTLDPYTGPSAIDYLNQFQSEVNANYNGDLAHLIGLGQGGVAYIDVLCNSYWGIGYSGITTSYEEVPVYSWSVEVLTHEIGHNLGSPHTHACAWNGNNTAIDGCGPDAGANEGCDGPIPSSGTIMSYCHLLSGVGIDFNLGFGTQPGDLVRDNVYNASCLNSCSNDPVCTTIGDVCNDGDPCTTGDTVDSNCNCVGTFIDDDNDGYCVGDDTDDNDPCVPDNSGMDCTVECTEYDFETIETGWGIWNDGGSDCIRIISSSYSYEGARSILIRDNSNASSSTTTDNLLAGQASSIQLDFAFYPLSMETGEDFFLEVSTNGGSTYTIVESWVSGAEFNNNTFYLVSSTISDVSFTDQTKLRLRCDASSNADRIYLDNLKISICSGDDLGCTTTGLPCDDGDSCTLGETYDIDCNCTGGVSTDLDADGVCMTQDPDDSDPCIPNPDNENCDNCTTVGFNCSDGDPCTIGESISEDCECEGGIYTDEDGDGLCIGEDPDDNDACIPNSDGCIEETNCSVYNDEGFEFGWGIWNDGGSDCTRIFSSFYAATGNYSIRIRDNSGASSSTSTDNLPANNSSQINVTFTFYPNSMETNEEFLLEISNNGGSSYSVVDSWVSGTDFSNGSFYTETVEITGNFTNTTRLRFRCDASTNSDQIFLDDIKVELCGGSSSIPEVLPEISEFTDSKETIEDPIISLYPNPVSANTEVYLEVITTDNDKEIFVHDINGRLIYKCVEPGSNENITIQTTGYQPNIYIITVLTDEARYQQRLVIN